MTEPMSDARLAQLELAAGTPLPFDDVPTRVVHEALAELVAEVKRLRALDVPSEFVTPIDGSVASEQIAEWQAAWDKLWTAGVVNYGYTPPPRPDPPDFEPMRNLVQDGPRTWNHPVGG